MTFLQKKSLAEVSSFHDGQNTSDNPPLFIFTTVMVTCALPVAFQLSSELAPPLVEEVLLFDLLDERKENRLMRRREKLPDFLWRLSAVTTKLLSILEMSSWD